MARLNLVKTLNLIAEESPRGWELHPYRGVKDASGWLTRYPLSVGPLLTREWVMGYIEACRRLLIDVSFDSQECYGPSPYALWLEGYEPQLIAKLVCVAHGNRFDNIPHLNRMSEAGITINPEIETADLKILISGWDKMQVVGPIRPVMTLGRMSWYTAGALEAKRLMKEKKEDAFRAFFKIVPAKTAGEVYAHIAGFRDAIRKMVPGIDLKAERRYARDIQAHLVDQVDRKYRRDLVTSARRIELMLKLNRTGVAERVKRSRNIWVEPVEYGDLLKISGKPEFFRKYASAEIEKINFKALHGYEVAMIGKQCFVFNSDYSRHVERATLREAIEVMTATYAVEGLKMSLEDVVTARGFCLVGTKDFLKNKMPHLYRLVENAKKWEDVPAEIMKIKWELTSREIFRGFPEP